MSGLAETLLSRARNSFPVTTGREAAIGNAIQPRTPARYETFEDRLGSLVTDASPGSDTLSLSQPQAVRTPLSGTIQDSANAVQSTEVPFQESKRASSSPETGHFVRKPEMQKFPDRSDSPDRADLFRRDFVQRAATSDRRQADGPITQIQGQTQRAVALEALSPASRTEVRKDEGALLARPIEPRTGATDEAIKSAVDSALEPGINQAAKSWLESKLNSRLDGDRATDTVRTRRERSQQESHARPLAAAEPSVEIHIGRIEIRAASPQPAPARRAQRQPISLEEYGRAHKGEAR